MKIYDFLKIVSEKYCEERAEELFDFFIHAMDDDGGFLRTRWCYWDKSLIDGIVYDDIRTVLITAKESYDLLHMKYYERGEGGWKDYLLTNLKIQIFYYDESDSDLCSQDIEWSNQLGYGYYTLLDLKEEAI